MRRLCWMLPLLMVACSCQRAPAVDPVTDGRTPTGDVAPASNTSSAPAIIDVPLDALSAVAGNAPDPGSVVRSYASQLPMHDRAVLDASWQVPPPAGRADDAALRELKDIITLRVNTGMAVARDQQNPSRLIEVPVRVRAVTGQGTLHYTGWYRLVPDPAGTAWLIQSAHIQPVLD